MIDVSVIICTHNPRENYLQRVFDALNRQTLSKEQWELLLIDNASDEPLISKWDLSWHPHARQILEENLGLTRARLAGIRESASDLILFLDDDNVAAPDYLEKLIYIVGLYPWIGCFGAGTLTPEFEEEPAPELRPYCRKLALRTVERAMWSNIGGDSCTPWGAGLAVRGPIARRYVEVVSTSPIRLDLGRRGAALLRGEDDEFSWIASEMSLGKGIFPELRIVHLISRARVQLAYLERIEEGHALSGVLMDYVHGVDPESSSERRTWPRIVKSWLRSMLAIAAAYTSGSRTARRAFFVARRMSVARERGTRKGVQFITANRFKTKTI